MPPITSFYFCLLALIERVTGLGLFLPKPDLQPLNQLRQWNMQRIGTVVVQLQGQTKQ